MTDNKVYVFPISYIVKQEQPKRVTQELYEIKDDILFVFEEQQDFNFMINDLFVVANPIINVCFIIPRTSPGMCPPHYKSPSVSRVEPIKASVDLRLFNALSTYGVTWHLLHPGK